MQWQARAEIEEVTARSGEAEQALQMALLADRIRSAGAKLAGLTMVKSGSDDSPPRFTCSAPGPWQRSHPMAWPSKTGGS